ncbi:exo-alpha-sialidase [Sedimentisphaera salicampi]|uniref:exo-alpha-sialidase n=1 Tax=Sedimentisphaera salicampi TaxID=1941349 RepID=A0A1W6LK97_9BACT|nr:exo-alpha-sialidase [Sedimentisphaera salicampi]ARN56176.1 Sialidase precursor [Sedimentisphaera salicampi]
MKAFFTAVAVFLLPCFLVASPLQDDVLFEQGEEGYNTFRIPALYETSSGALLAFAEGRVNGAGDTGNIDTVLKRSIDGGESWLPMQVVWDDGGNTCGNPTVLQDPFNGRVWLFMTHNLGQDHQSEISRGTSDGVRTIWSCWSDDDGKSWSVPETHYPEIDPFDDPPNGWDATGPGRGIVLKKGTNAGRLIIPAIERNIYSDDHGQTWQESSFLPPGSSESQIVELSNGTLLRNDRNVCCKETNRRLLCFSYNQGLSWTSLLVADQLITPICQGSTIALSSSIGQGGQMYTFSNPAATSRIRMTVKYSYDDCSNWTKEKLIHSGPSGYSCLTGIAENYIGLLYEAGESRYYETIRFAKFRRQWVHENTVFRWDFEEFDASQTLAAGSDVQDSLGYGYKGELSDSLELISAQINSKPQKAVSFSGQSGQGIVLGDGESQNMLDVGIDEPITIKAVFRTENHKEGGSVGAGAIVSKDVGPNVPSWWMRVQDGFVRFYMEDGSNPVSLWSSSEVCDNQWHQVRVVRDPSQEEVYLYLDGQLEDSQSDQLTASAANSNDIVVGAFNAVQRNFIGDIASVQIYKSAAFTDECGEWGYNQMDLNKDCYVDTFDLYLFMNQWLDTTNPL